MAGREQGEDAGGSETVKRGVEAFDAMKPGGFGEGLGAVVAELGAGEVESLEFGEVPVGKGGDSASA